MIAGTLELQMLANLAELRQDMNEAKNVVGGAMSSMNSAIGNLKTGMQALVGYFSVHAIEGFLERIFEGITNMREFGKEAGVSAEALSRFEAPARMAGSSVELVAASMFRMNKALTEAKTPGSLAAQALTAIGLSVRDLQGLSADEQFEKIARAMDKFAEGTDRNAIAMTLFSRGGKEVNKLIEEIGKTTQLSASITNEQAEAAKKLEDEYVKLKMASEAMWRHTISDAIPGLTKIVEQLAEAAKQTGLWKTAIIGLAGIFGIDLTNALGAATNKTTELYNKIFELEQRMRAASPVLMGANYAGYIKMLQDQIDKLKLQTKGGSGSNNPQLLYDLEAPGSFKPAPKFDPEAFKKNEEYWKRFRELEGEAELQMYEDMKKSEKLTEEMANKSAVEWAKSVDAGTKAIDEFLKQTQDMDRQYQDTLDMIGKTPDQIEKIRAARRIDLEAAKAAAAFEAGDGDVTSEANRKKQQQIYDIAEARKKGIAVIIDETAQQRAQMEIWDQIGTAAGTFFSDLVMHGKVAFDNLRTMLKQLAADLLAFFAKKWVLQMVAGAMAGSAVGTAAGAAENQLGSSLLGIAGSAAMSYLGGVLSAGAGSLVSIFGTGLAANVATFGTALSGGVSAVGGFAAALSAAIPVIGALAVIGGVLAAAFGQHHGTPKSGGSFLGSFDSAGNLLGDMTPGLDRSQHLHDETNMDSTARQLVIGVGQTFGQLLAHYGGTSSGLQFGLGFNRDSGGTAPSMVSSLVRDASGRTVFEQQNRNVGRSDSEVTAEIQLQASRAILAGLQVSDLPHDIAGILKSVDAATATQDAINNIYAIADAFQQLKGATSDLNLNDMVSQISKGPVEQLHDMSSALLGLAHNTTMTAASLQTMTQSTLAYRQQVAQLVQAFQQAESSIHDMYAQTARSIQLTNLNPQQQYNFYQEEAARLLTQVQNSNSAEEISSLSQRINQDIMSAYNLLSPEQQVSMQQDFLTRISTTDQTTHDRLEAVQKAAVDAANATLKEIRDIMDAAADKMGKAGDDISNAATNQHVEVDIHVQDDRLNAVVTDSG